MERAMGVLSVRELNANISKALARVEAGEVLDISRNGKVIAELRPKRPVRDAAWQKAYDESVAFMRKGLPLGIGKVTAEDKYGDLAG
jgi:antitoxin (DNA-binding transcriptional repressor) of toxin-antitoxin stability system